MTIHVHYWSYFKDIVGSDHSVFEVPPETTLGQLQDRIGQLFPKMAALRGCTLASVGVDYQTAEHPLRDGDQVSLFPPVQGG
jgi:molybdopterin converting factor small subunit